MRTRRPISINNSLSHGICNYSCRLCSVNKSSYRGPKAYQPREVTERLISRIEEAAESGIHVRYVANAGDGEPTLHPEFTDRMGMFGRMLRNWNAAVPAPEVSVVSNGARLTRPGILDAIAGNGLSLIVSFPTPVAETYGEIMVGEPARGPALMEQVVPGIQAAMRLAGEGTLQKLYFHVSPPEREVVRRDFPKTLAFLTEQAQAAGLKEVSLIMFPATSNRSGLIRNWVGGTDMYRDFFRQYDGVELNGVTVRLKLVLNRFFRGFREIADLVRAFKFPCLWNANLFITADGSSICCNDQAVREPMGSIMDMELDELMVAKESRGEGRICGGCDQRPEQMRGSLAAVVFALAARVRHALAGRPASRRLPGEAPVAAGTYSFGSQNEYTVRVASGLSDRLKAWALVYRLYLEKGYAQEDSGRLWYGIHDVLPDTTTLLVELAGEPLATLTLVPDSPLGLPADKLYREELDGLRARGRRPCEIISLACDEGNLRRGAEIMKHIFKVAWLAADRVMDATDFFITVNPRHVGFYRRTLLMEPQGPQRSYGKVGGAPAVLLGLDFATARERFRERYGEAPGSFHHFFVNPATEPGIVRMVERGRGLLTQDDICRYFVVDRPLIPELPTYLQHYLEECYPEYRLLTPAPKPVERHTPGVEPEYSPETAAAL